MIVVFSVQDLSSQTTMVVVLIAGKYGVNFYPAMPAGSGPTSRAKRQPILTLKISSRYSRMTLPPCSEFWPTSLQDCYYLTRVSMARRFPASNSTTPLMTSWNARSSFAASVKLSGLLPSCTRTDACRTYAPDGSMRVHDPRSGDASRGVNGLGPTLSRPDDPNPPWSVRGTRKRRCSRRMMLP